jgi:hypothetical protein
VEPFLELVLVGISFLHNWVLRPDFVVVPMAAETLTLLPGGIIQDMTFITVPRPSLNGVRCVRCSAAFATWLSTAFRSRILVFASADEFCPGFSLLTDLCETFGTERLRFIGRITLHSYGVPLIPDWFCRGLQAAQSRYVTFINADIILTERWMERMAQVFRALDGPYHPIVISDRINFRFSNSFVWGGDLTTLARKLRKSALTTRHRRAIECSMDTWTFEASLLQDFVKTIPPFLMGLPRWDNWITSHLEQKYDLVSTMMDPPILHMSHRRNRFNMSDPRLRHNLDIFEQSKLPYIGHHNCHWAVCDGFLIERRRHGRRIRLSGYQPGFLFSP